MRTEHAFIQNNKRKINDFNLKDKIKIFTNFPHEKIGNFYKQADFVLPAERESVSISVLEAQNYDFL